MERAQKIIGSLGFDGVCVVDAIGYAGGIWCLWSTGHLQVVPVVKLDQLDQKVKP